MLRTLPFLEVVQETMTCSICFDLFTIPVAFPCGHVFCTACAARAAAERPQCPLCNAKTPSRASRMIPLPGLTLVSQLAQEVAKNVTVQLGATKHHRASSSAGSSSSSSSGNRCHTEEGEGAGDDDEKRSESRSVSQQESSNISKICRGEGGGGRNVPSTAVKGEGGRASEAMLMVSGCTQRLTSASRSPVPPLCSSTPPPPLPQLEVGYPGAVPSTLPLWGDETPLIHTRAGASLEDSQHLTPRQPSAAAHIGGDARSRDSDNMISLHLEVRRPVPSGVGGSVDSTSDDTSGLQLAGGKCVLCGLDVTDRQAVVSFLKALLRSSKSDCDRAELAAITELSLGAMLGPVWRVRMGALPRLNISEGEVEEKVSVCAGKSGRRRKRVMGGCGTRHHHDDAFVSLDAVAHQNCLAWTRVLGDNAYTECMPCEWPHVSAMCWTELEFSTTVHFQKRDLRSSEGQSGTTGEDCKDASAEALRKFCLFLLSDACAQASSPLDRAEAPYLELEGKAKPPRVPLRQPLGVSDLFKLQGAEPLAALHCCAVCGEVGTAASLVALRPCQGSTAFSSSLAASTTNSNRGARGKRRLSSHGSCNRYFHFLCALLAGPRVCIVLGVEEAAARWHAKWRSEKNARVEAENANAAQGRKEIGGGGGRKRGRVVSIGDVENNDRKVKSEEEQQQYTDVPAAGMDACEAVEVWCGKCYEEDCKCRSAKAKR